MEEQGREILLESWMEAKLLAVTAVARTPTSKHAPKSVNYGWQPLRDVLLIMLDTGMRPVEVFRMEWEHVKWNRELIFVPRSKSRKSKRYVPLSKRVKEALQMRVQESRFIFSSARSKSGHIETVQKQFARAKKLAGLPKAVVLYCARHRFSTDAMDGNRQCNGRDGCHGPQQNGHYSSVPASRPEADRDGDQPTKPSRAVSTKPSTSMNCGCRKIGDK